MGNWKLENKEFSVLNQGGIICKHCFLDRWCYLIVENEEVKMCTGVKVLFF